jgi:hypothetical protein
MAGTGARPFQTAFTSGYWSPALRGRVDLEGYFYALAAAQNVIVRRTGGVSRRGGTEYAGFAKQATSYTERLIPFQYSRDPKQSYLIEAGERFLRFYWGQDRGLIQVNTPSHPEYFKNTSPGLGIDDLTVSGTYTGSGTTVFRVRISGEDPDTFDWYIDNVIQDAYVPITGEAQELALGISITFGHTELHETEDFWEFAAGYPYEIATPYKGADCADLRVIQRADTLYLFHPEYMPRKLQRHDHDDWRMEVVDFINPAWLGRTSGLRWKLYRTGPTPQVPHPIPTTPLMMDEHFDPAYGAEFLAEAKHYGEIAWSTHSGWYNAPPEEIQDLHGSYQHFAWQAEGPITIPVAGMYRFAINSGWAGDLYIDNQPVVAWLGQHDQFDPGAAGAQTNYETHSGKIELQAGAHTIRVRVVNNNGAGSIGVAAAWKRPGDMTYAVIPASAYVEQSDSSGVTPASYRVLTLAEAVALPETAEAMATATTEGVGVAVARRGIWDERLWFHSLAGAPVAPFAADRSAVPLPDGTKFGLVLEGWLHVVEAGNYQFAIDSNDASDFVLHRGDPATPTASLAWYGEHGCASQGGEYNAAGLEQHATGAVALEAGWYAWRARLVSVGWGYGLALAWKTPGAEAWVPIPREQLAPKLDGYPACGCLFQGRLWLGGFTDRPMTVYGSRSGQLEDYTQGANAGDGIELTVDSNAQDLIQAIVPGKDLYILTSAGEYRLAGGEEGITPRKFKIEQQSAIGAAAVEPVRVENSTLFIARGGRRVLEWIYSMQYDALSGEDISELAADLFAAGIAQIVYQPSAVVSPGADPVGILWARTAAGGVMALTHDRKNKTFAWAPQNFDGVVESLAVLPGVDGGFDLWLCLKRTGLTRTIEALDVDRQMDGSVVFSGTHQLALPHLAGTLVRARWGASADAIVGTRIVQLDAQGEAEVDGLEEAPPAYLEAGKEIEWYFVTMPVEVQLGQGTSQGIAKRWKRVGVYLRQTAGGVDLAAAERTDRAQRITAAPAAGKAFTLYTGVKEAKLLGWSEEAQLRVSGSEPFPVTVLGIRGEVELEMG